MKTLLLWGFVLFSPICFSQSNEKLYDHDWKPTTNVKKARFFSITQKRDSLWVQNDYFIFEKKLQMTGSYKDSAQKIRHGEFRWYHANGTLETMGSFINDRRVGTWVSFYENGVMRDSSHYVYGNKKGISLSWHYNGFMSDSTAINSDGSSVVVQWFDNGIPSAAGRLTANGKLNGKWQFFHKNGNLSSLEMYDNGQLVSKEYFDEKGNKETDLTDIDSDLDFPGGREGWQKFMNKHIYWPSGLKFQTDGEAVVEVRFAVDEEGKVVDAYVSLPLHPDFDRIALRAIRQSPKWKPAIAHHRKIKSYRTQQVTFSQHAD